MHNVAHTVLQGRLWPVVSWTVDLKWDPGCCVLVSHMPTVITARKGTCPLGKMCGTAVWNYWFCTGKIEGYCWFVFMFTAELYFMEAVIDYHKTGCCLRWGHSPQIPCFVWPMENHYIRKAEGCESFAFFMNMSEEALHPVLFIHLYSFSCTGECKLVENNGAFVFVGIRKYQN